MTPVRFIHAADLHLDAAFAGLCREAPAELVRRLHEATFTAAARLFDLCEAERPDFLLLAGDISNQEDQSLRAQLMLHERCRRLETLGVRVFLVHGNHDPYPARLKTLRWPDNVTLFGEEPESRLVTRDGAPLAVIHGVSHASAKETRNLAARFQRTEDPCLQIGLLHTTLGAEDGETRYAPCSLDDLTASGLHYWALGHVHEQREICRRPLAVYPGSTQGLHINEQGEKGCLLVTAEPDGGDFRFTCAFKPLGPVIWKILDLPLDVPATTMSHSSDQPDASTSPAPVPADEACLADLEIRLRAALDEAVAGLWPRCEALILRLVLTGRTPFNALLRKPGPRAELLERLREAQVTGPLVFVKDLEVRTLPLLDRARLTTREDLLGEILRGGDELRATPELLRAEAAEALKDLFAHPRAKRALAAVDDDTLRQILDDAESLCAELLEND